MKIYAYEGMSGIYRRIRLVFIYLRQRITINYEIERIESGYLTNNGKSNSKVSIIIPTKNAGHEFDKTLKSFCYQKERHDIEIIIVDSGSKDNTLDIANKYKTKLLKVNTDQFNHGLTRNIAAAQATGNYLIFTVQDAVPLNNKWLESMIYPFKKDSNIAAISCKQFLREDADLFARYLNYIQNESMGFNYDQVRYVYKSVDYNNLNPSNKRRLSQLDNVCCCYRKDIFDLYKFKEVAYAEDLEIGSRLAKNGYKLGFLSSNGVIHSHNRSSVHFFKRGYIDTRLSPKILEYYPGIPILPRGITLEHILKDMIDFYFNLKRIISSINWLKYNSHGLSFLPPYLRKELQSLPVETNYFDEEMESFQRELINVIGQPKKIDIRKLNNIFNDGFIMNLERFRYYVFRSETNVNHESFEITMALFKLLGLWFGSYLGNIINAAERENNKLIYQESIDTLLSNGL